MATTGTIIVHRLIDANYSARPFKILIDGVVAGQVWTGRAVDFEVTPGRHSVRVRVDWNSSPEIYVDVVAAGQVVLATEAGAIRDVFVNPGRYLRLYSIDQ